MLDPVSQQAIQDIGNKGVSHTPVEPSVVSSEEAEAFQNMLESPSLPPIQHTEIKSDMDTGVVHTEDQLRRVEQILTVNENVVQVTAVEGEPSLGDRILQGIEGAQKDLQAGREQLMSDLQGDGQISKMYELQLQVGQMATSQQVMGQVGSKTSQGVQTLLKGQ